MADDNNIEDKVDVRFYDRLFCENILTERIRQDKKWGEQWRHDGFKWLSILVEEVGELAKAILERDGEAARERVKKKRRRQMKNARGWRKAGDDLDLAACCFITFMAFMGAWQLGVIFFVFLALPSICEHSRGGMIPGRRASGVGYHDQHIPNCKRCDGLGRVTRGVLTYWLGPAECPVCCGNGKFEGYQYEHWEWTLSLPERRAYHENRIKERIAMLEGKD